MAGSKISELVWNMAEPIAADNDAEIWDVEFVKEGADWYLRVLLDREGGININQCEAVSRALGKRLDDEDPIPHAYYLEVSSAGIERPLKRESDFRKFLGHKVLARLYKAENGVKEFTGVIQAYENGVLTLVTEDGNEKIFERASLSLVRLVADF